MSLGAGLIPCIVIPLMAGLVIVAIIAAQAAAKKRREAFAQLAASLGYTYEPGPFKDFDDRYPRFECFRRGHSRQGLNFVHGPLRSAPDRGRCLLGEYQFSETHSNGKSTNTVTFRFGFVIVETRWTSMPDVLVRPENFFDKMAGVLGFDDIDFESAEFSRKWMVKSSDKRFAYDLIDARMMEYLMGQGTPMIDIGGQAICFWYSQTTRLEPAQLAWLLQWVEAFLARWPRVLVEELDERNGLRPPPPPPARQADDPQGATDHA